jgi:putative hemolysin
VADPGSLAIGIASLFLLAMLGLSALFSASEAALFSLTTVQRSQLLDQNRSDKAIIRLLANPSQLLSCILLCNLFINITFFACSNVIVSWITSKDSSAGLSIFFGFASVAAVILFGELLPKSLGVLAPLKISRLIAIPMSGIMSAVKPLSVAMQAVNDVCRRLIWPGLVPETVLETTDLERAIELSETDSQLIDLEKGILQNILQLSSIQAPDWMHPRSQFDTVTQPCSQEILSGWHDEHQDPPMANEHSEIVLVLSPMDGEIVATTTRSSILAAVRQQTPLAATPAVYVPWCSNLAHVFQMLLKQDIQTAVVVNERGDTIGVLFVQDIIEAVFASSTTSIHTTGRPLVAKTGETKWEATGATRIKQLERTLGIKLPETRDATIAGVLQSQLRRTAVVGDAIQWGQFSLLVTEIPRRGEMLVQIASSEIDMAIGEAEPS